MDLNDTPEQAEYRARVRAWVERNRDDSPPPVKALHLDDVAPYRRWQGKLAAAGLVGVTWPAEYGGAGLGPAEQIIVASELSRAGCAGIVDHIAIGELGPTIIAYGTDEQKRRYLAPMLHGEEGWCQLFSEPAAGSDLAGLQTRATRDDAGWVVSGQKVWTTMAQFADFGLLLARTDAEVPKHRGLTMFIVPMNADGVTVRPLRQVSGHSGFNEVFFDEVRLDEDATVGPVDGGWGVAMTTLMFERMAILAALDELPWGIESFVGPLLDSPRLEDSDIRRRIAELAVDAISLKYTTYRALSALGQGKIPGPEAGLGKISVIEMGRRGCELLADVFGPDMLEGEIGAAAAEMPGMRSAGGTEEILRNTIGERVLGLPPEPRFDKDIPFSELSRNGKAGRAREEARA
jgi:alkylation response protein AidB-like acyl-CoA dehydrogenase